MAPLPKLAILDLTLAGDGSATGELKAALLGDWPQKNLFHLYATSRYGVGFKGKQVNGAIRSGPSRPNVALQNLVDFDPDVVLYRPTPTNPLLHELSMRYIRATPAPLVIWIMDDWPEVLRATGKRSARNMLRDLDWLLERACFRLCISESMQRTYRARYGLEFTPMANGVDPRDWPLAEETPAVYESAEEAPGADTVVRYAGALTDNMGLASVARVARSVEQLAQQGLPIRFEIHTSPTWAGNASRIARDLEACSVHVERKSVEEYRRTLQSADILLIAYNFDPESITYVKHSIANKLPECLISGSLTLVHGPEGVATVDFVARKLKDITITEPSEPKLMRWLNCYARSEEARRKLALRCRELAIAEFDLNVRQEALLKVIEDATSTPAVATVPTPALTRLAGFMKETAWCCSGFALRAFKAVRRRLWS